MWNLPGKVSNMDTQTGCRTAVQMYLRVGLRNQITAYT